MNPRTLAILILLAALALLSAADGINTTIHAVHWFLNGKSL